MTTTNSEKAIHRFISSKVNVVVKTTGNWDVSMRWKSLPCLYWPIPSSCGEDQIETQHVRSISDEIVRATPIPLSREKLPISSTKTITRKHLTCLTSSHMISESRVPLTNVNIYIPLTLSARGPFYSSRASCFLISIYYSLWVWGFFFKRCFKTNFVYNN